MQTSKIRDIRKSITNTYAYQSKKNKTPTIIGMHIIKNQIVEAVVSVLFPTWPSILKNGIKTKG